MKNKKNILKIFIFFFLFFIYYSGLSFSNVYPTYLKTISSDYGPRLLDTVPDWHKGLDFPVPSGTPVKSVSGGDANYINYDINPKAKKGDGNAIGLYSFDKGYEITYKHLLPNFDVVRNGKLYQFGFINLQGPKNKSYNLFYIYDYWDNVFTYYIDLDNYSKNIKFIDVFGNENSPEKISLSFAEGEIFSGSGNTGYSKGPHLHVEVYDYNEQKQDKINPLNGVLPFVNSWEMNVTIPYPTHLQGKDYYTPDTGTKEIAIRANVDSRYDYDLNKVEFFIDQNNPPQTLVHKISFDPRDSAYDIFLFSSDPVSKTGCYPRDNGDDDFAYKWDITGKSGDYYVQVRATDIKGCEECKYKSPVLHIKLGIKTKVQVIDSETALPVEGAEVTLSNTQLAYYDTETTAGTVAAAAARVSTVTAYSEPLPPGVALFEDLQPNTTYNVLIKKQGYEDSDKDTITTNDSIITPTEDNQTLTLAIKPKPVAIVILHDTTTLDSPPVESESIMMPDEPYHRWSCVPCVNKYKNWDVQYQTAQGRLVGYGLERITQISLRGVSHVNLYINDILAPNGVWTKNPETEKIIPTLWKVVFNPDSYFSPYVLLGLQVTAGNKSFVRSLALFSYISQSAGGGDCGGWTGTGQKNIISLSQSNNQIISIADLPQTEWTVEGGACPGRYREFYAHYSYWENILDKYLCYSLPWPPCEKIIPIAPSPPSYLPMKVRAVVEPNLSSDEKSILKDLGLPEQPQTILSGSQ